MNAYTHNIGDYAMETKFLTFEQKGIFVDMVDQYLATGKPLASDWVANIKRLASENAVEFVLEQFFELRDGKYHNEKCDALLAESQKRSERNRANAQKTRVSKKSATRKQVASDSQATEKPLASDSLATRKPVANNTEENSISPHTPLIYKDISISNKEIEGGVGETKTEIPQNVDEMLNSFYETDGVLSGTEVAQSVATAEAPLPPMNDQAQAAAPVAAPKKRGRKKASQAQDPEGQKPESVQKPEGVSDEVWANWCELKSRGANGNRSKRVRVTPYMLNAMIRESEKAGLTLQEAMTFQLEQGWQGFNAEWYGKRHQKSPRQQETERRAKISQALQGDVDYYDLSPLYGDTARAD